MSGLSPHIRRIAGQIAARVPCISASRNPAETIQSRVRLHERLSAVRTSLSLFPHKQNYARCSLGSVQCTWGAWCGHRFSAVVKRGRMLDLFGTSGAPASALRARCSPPAGFESVISTFCGFDPTSNRFGSLPCRLTKQINEHSHILQILFCLSGLSSFFPALQQCTQSHRSPMGGWPTDVTSGSS